MVCDVNQVHLVVYNGVVLILILLEYGLRHNPCSLFVTLTYRLNPYSIGIWSATLVQVHLQMENFLRLNPYSIGIWSATHSIASHAEQCHVLILILLEYGLRHFWLLHEEGQGGLNPYSIGIWSATQFKKDELS